MFGVLDYRIRVPRLRFQVGFSGAMSVLATFLQESHGACWKTRDVQLVYFPCNAKSPEMGLSRCMFASVILNLKPYVINNRLTRRGPVC